MTEMLDASDHDRAAEILALGGTVAIPTETVYGLAADASSDAAVAKIFEAKGRPAGHPLIVHLHSTEQLADWTTSTDERATRLAEAFWPGPLTLILPRTDLVSDLVVGGRSTIGIRIPAHPVARSVIEAFSRRGSGGVAAPSANRFGHVSPTTAQHVMADLDGRIDAVLDGGPSSIGVESTIVELLDGRPATLLRPGGVPAEAIQRVLGDEVVDGRAGESRAAGMLASHYSPRAAVVIAERVDPGVLGPTTGIIGPVEIEHPHLWWLPSEAGAYAEGLYAALRAADTAGMETLIVVPPTHGPLLDAVLDRLAKAAVGT